MAAMMLTLINFNNGCALLKFISINLIAAICWPPPLISQLFHPGFLRPHLFSQLGCFCVDITTGREWDEDQVIGYVDSDVSF